MSDDHPTPPLNRVLTTAREYLTHWFIAGIVVTLTGFAPDHWVAHLFHAVRLDGFLDALPAADYRLIVVGLGVLVSTLAVIFQISRMQKRQLAAVALNAVGASAPAPLSQAGDTTDPTEGKPSIAVLPFVNMSDDKSQDYFADGMTEDIITGLSCDSRLFVIARNSTFAYKGLSPDIRAVGKELGVRYVLEGSIRPIGDRLRITVQLVETDTGAHVWADKIDRPVAEIFAVMDELVDGLVTTLCSSLGVAESHRTQRQRPENLHAWALCVQAEVMFYSYTDSKNRLEAENLARRATEIEPGYAVSWALLGFMTSLRIIWGLSHDLAKDSEEAMSLVNKALRLAPNDPEVLGYCGSAACYAGHGMQAIDYLERSLAINPNSSSVRLSYGRTLMHNGKLEQAISQLELCLRRSPKDPYIGRVYFFLSICYLTLDDFTQAEQFARNAVKHSPGNAWVYMALAMSLAALKRDAEARQQIQKTRQLEAGFPRQHVEDFWRHGMPRDQAEKLISLLRQVWTD